MPAALLSTLSLYSEINSTGSQMDVEGSNYRSLLHLVYIHMHTVVQNRGKISLYIVRGVGSTFTLWFPALS
jgi:hypothetical protein